MAGAAVTIAAKKRVALALLSVLAVWPAVHYGLYLRYAIEPWKLFGWAMYARPRAVPQLGVFALEDGREIPLRLEGEAVLAEVERLGRMRGALGELQSMDSLGRLLLVEHPSVDAIRVVVRRVSLDCSTAMLDDVRTYSYDYRR